MNASTTSRAQAVSLAPKSEIQRLRALPVSELRALAAAQIVRARAAWEKASDLSWTAGIAQRWVNARRWEPDAKQIQLAEEALSLGDQEANESDRKTRYISAWTTSRLAIQHIAEEAKFGPTDAWYLLALPGEGAKDAAVEFGRDVLRPLAETAGEAGRAAGEALSGIFKGALVLAGLYFGAEALRRTR